jgi:hypothetical protein
MYMDSWSRGFALGSLPPASMALSTISSTLALLSNVRQVRTSVVLCASANGFFANSLNLSRVSSMALMSSEKTMQAAVLSVNFKSFLKPTALKNATDLSRSLTGRLTNIWVAMLISFAELRCFS